MASSLCNEEEIGSRDRISRLPDSLLHHILSFLPTKEVVATSLLSKRWRSLWQSISTLEFDDTSFRSLDLFLQFVDAVLILGDFITIEKFLLKCGSGRVPPVKINIWIDAAIRRKVEHLDLMFPSYYKFSIDLPSRIFNCSTVRVLKLSGGIKVNTLSSVNLPSLKVLHLVRFLSFQCMAELLSGCPLLEILVLKPLDVHDNSSALHIESLKHLVSADVPCFLIRLRAFSNVRVLRINTISWSPCHDIPIFYNLTHMEFSCHADNWNRIMKSLRNCPKLEILVIHQLYVSNPGGNGKSVEPILDVPRCLSSRLKEFSLGKYKGWECEFEIARFIMKNAGVLRTISIHSSIKSNANWKHEMLKRLSSCPRGSVNCRLLFN